MAFHADGVPLGRDRVARLGVGEIGHGVDRVIGTERGRHLLAVLIVSHAQIGQAEFAAERAGHGGEDQREQREKNWKSSFVHLILL